MRRIVLFLGLSLLAPGVAWSGPPPIGSPHAVVTSVARAASRDFFPVPRAAYRNRLGVFPPHAPCTVFDSGDSTCTGAVAQPAPFANANPAAQPGLGVPLGGVGAGSFMINQAGSFGPWDFGGADQIHYENRILPQAAFHLYEKVGSQPSRTRTLVTRSEPWADIPETWHALRPGQGTYSALYPFGWTSYTSFATDVSVRFWSPIIRGEDRRSSMPVAYFDVRLANHTDDRSTVSAMFTMPNAPEHIGPAFQDPPVEPDMATVRTGLGTELHHDSQSGVTGLSLSADSRRNTPDAQHSDWTIAVRPGRGVHVSYVSSWNARGNGKDIYRSFRDDGRLPNRALDSSRSAGAIAASATLRPGQVRIIPFALAWDFPLTQLPAETAGLKASTWWMRRYVSFLGAKEDRHNDYVAGSYRPHRGFEIADDMLAHRRSALRAVLGWWAPIVRSRHYPGLLVREALNELGATVFSSSFWESGRVMPAAEPQGRVGSSIPGSHLFCTITGGGYDGCNEWDTDSYGYFADDELLPDLERGKLLLNLEAQVSQMASATSPVPGSTQFQDVPMKSIFRAWAYFEKTQDPRFLRFAYPIMLSLARHLRQGIKPGDHFPTDYPGQSSTYDIVEVVGHGIYNSSLWLLTEEVMAAATRAARHLGVASATAAVERRFAGDLPAAKTEFERLFWDPMAGHYRIDAAGSYGNAYFIDVFYAEHIATDLGLPSLIPRAHAEQHLKQAFGRFMQIKDASGHLVGPPLIVPQVGPPFPPPCSEICEVWQGSAMSAAAAYISEGHRLHDRELVRMGIRMAAAVSYQTTDNVSNGFLFDAPEGWYAVGTSTYRSPSFNRSRFGLDLLNSIAPLPGRPYPVPEIHRGSDPGPGSPVER